MADMKDEYTKLNEHKAEGSSRGNRRQNSKKKGECAPPRSPSDELPAVQSRIPEKLVVRPWAPRRLPQGSVDSGVRCGQSQKAHVNHHSRAAPNELYTVDAITNRSIDTDDSTVEFEVRWEGGEVTHEDESDMQHDVPEWSTSIGNAFPNHNQTVIVRFPLGPEDLQRSNHAFKRYKRAMRPINGMRRKDAGWKHLVTAHQYAYHRMLVELRFERHALERAMRRNEAEGDQAATDQLIKWREKLEDNENWLSRRVTVVLDVVDQHKDRCD